MITGSVSSDEDDDYDFGYSEPLVRRKHSPTLPSIQTKEIREELHAALEASKKRAFFFKAVDDGDLDTLKKLLSLGVGVDDSGPQEWTPLMKACGIGKFEVVEFLLSNNSDPNLHKELFTPLMACCTYSLINETLKLNCARLLLQYGANVNMTDKYKTTALMYAIKNCYFEIANELLSVPEIDINLRDKEGWNALFYAVDSNNLDMIKKLIAAGIDLNLKDRFNRTVMNLALDKDLKEAAELLGYIEEDHSARIEEIEKTYENNFLSELPSLNGQGGFPSETQYFISLYSQSKVKTTSFPHFLNMTDEDLNNIGIKLKPVRKKILKGIHSYHLQPWRKSSLPSVTSQATFRMEDAVDIMGNLLRTFTIANASLKYLDSRITKRISTSSTFEANDKELINILVNLHSLVNSLEIKMHKIYKKIDQIPQEFQSDHIEYSPRVDTKGKLAKYFWYTLSATTAGFLLYFFKCRNFS